MIVTVGLRDHQVLQRGCPTSGPIAVSGSADQSLRLAVLDASGDHVVLSDRVGPGEWSLEVDVPVGGPYDVVTVLLDGTRQPVVMDVLVGDLWVLAGQSNMQGVGRLDEELEPADDRVRVLDPTGRWRLATDPLHGAFVEPGDLVGGRGAGLGVAFGVEMVAATGVPVGLIAVAKGGSTLDHWAPGRAEQDGWSMFEVLIRAVADSGGRLAGMLWHQGESEGIMAQPEGFGRKLDALVTAFRAQLRAPDLPFFHVQVGRFVADGVPGAAADVDLAPAWNAVREEQRTSRLGPGGLTTAIDLATCDLVHLSTGALRRLGRRLARLASGQARTIVVTSVEVAVPDPEHFEITVRYEGVAGRLLPAEHGAGFSLRDAVGVLVPRIFEVQAPPEDPGTVLIRCNGAPDPSHELWYGYGTDPYANLVDALDMALPAFGPWRLGSVDGDEGAVAR